MKHLARLSACLCTITALAVAFGLLYLGRPDPPVAGKVTSLQDGLHLSRQLDGKMASVQQSNAAKEAITADVIAGRRTLLEAAACFKAMAEPSPDFHWEMLRRTYPGGSDDERYCRMALSWAEQRLPQESSQAQSILAHLEAELKAHLDQHGTVVLPTLISQN